MNDSTQILSDVLETGILSAQAAQLVQMHLAMGASAPHDDIVAGLCFMVGTEASAVRAYDHAIRLYECSIELGNRSADVHYNLGNSLLNSARYDDADREYTVALEKDAENPNAFFNRGLSHSYRGDEHRAAAMDDFIAAGQLGCTIPSFGKVICDLAQEETGFLYVLHVLRESGFPGITAAILWSEFDDRLSSGCYLLFDITDSRGRDYDLWWWGRCVLADAFLGLKLNPEVRIRQLLDLADALAGQSAWHDLRWRAHYTVGIFANAPTMTNLDVKGLPMDVPSIFLTAADATEAVTASARHQLVNNPIDGIDLDDPAWQDRFALREYAEAARLVLLDAADMTARGSIDVERAWTVCEDVFREGSRVSVVLDEPGWLSFFCETARATYQVLASGEMPSAARIRFLDHALSGNDDVDLDVLSASRTDLTLMYFTSEIVEDRLDVLAIAGDETRCVEQAASIKPFRQSGGDRSVLDALLIANDFWSSPGARLDQLTKATEAQLLGAAIGIVERADYGAEPKTDDPMFGSVQDALFMGLYDVVDIAVRLTIVPYNYLQNVPFILFPTLKRLALKGMLRSLTYAPSGKLLQAARRLPPAPRSRCLFVGYSEFEDLDIAGELGVVRDRFEHTTSLLDNDATLLNVLGELASHDVVHFCCHGLHDVDKDEPYLQLAGGGLYPDDLLQYKGPVPALVVANACISAVSPRRSTNGDQVATLHSSWLMVGAKNVIGTQWRVNDEVAVRKCEAFYRHYLAERQVPAAEALMAAQREIAETYKEDALWAPFVCYGANN